MSEFAVRVRRIRMKDGADVHVLTNPRDPADYVPSIIERHAREIAQMDSPKSRLEGCLVIGIFSDGTASTGVKLPARLPRALGAAWLMEIIRRDIITENEAEAVFDRKFEWVE